jgi:hypothetical protein
MGGGRAGLLRARWWRVSKSLAPDLDGKVLAVDVGVLQPDPGTQLRSQPSSRSEPRS